MLYAVIMAGGQGTRLWPVSRKKLPKQLQRLASNKSLIQETYDRLSPIFPDDRIVVSTTPEYASEIKMQLPQIPEKNYVLEPFANGNAAACGLVSAVLNERDKDSSAVFLPADHAIKNAEQFQNILEFADRLISDYPNHIITIGIEPTKPDTGLGYIQIGKELDVEEDNLRAFKVKRFVEKPSLDRAKRYVSSWQYLWNAGMFVWRTDHILDLFNSYMPETKKVLDRIVGHWDKDDREVVLAAEYDKTENTSVDYGIMEKTKDILVVPGDFGWSDIGSWGTLFELLAEINDARVISRGHHLSCNDENCLVFANDKLVATVGLEDTVVIDTEDALLICNRHKAHQVKDLLTQLKEQNKEEYL
ncbi:MAG: Mannose-1-phosphate guanylyltransferase 1 [bacterium ADurb.Bin400]|nr:MAG: Mannose-1-phosphate guanylyltransferase 1 [bacterium ADurb.Bin400]